MIDLKTLIKSPVDLTSVHSGGIAVYVITVDNKDKYQFEINLSDTRDVGETATFMAHYDKAIILMRWIRKSLDNDTIIKIN